MRIRYSINTFFVAYFRGESGHMQIKTCPKYARRKEYQIKISASKNFYFKKKTNNEKNNNHS